MFLREPGRRESLTDGQRDKEVTLAVKYKPSISTFIEYSMKTTFYLSY
jgi:hypothetical protein